MTFPSTRFLTIVVAAMLGASACSSSQPSSESAETTVVAGSSSETTAAPATETAAATQAAVAAEAAVGTLDLTKFVDGALTEAPVTIDCTLTDGTATSCYQLRVAGFPANRDKIGPWCPATTSDGSAGIWFDGKAVYDIDGQFISNLAEIYNDPTWKLYDEDGNVLSTDTSEKFNDLVTGAPQADPNAGPVNLCVYGEIEWADGGGPIAATVEIPVNPIKADTSTRAGGKLGVTLDGVLIENSAPVDLILGNYTIGAFDPCGGHVNPQEGYHMHATTGCSNSTDEVPTGETPLFGYALDGFPIHAPYDAGTEPDPALDDCNGHDTPELGYHYHANTAEKNAVLTCFTGTTTEAAAGGQGSSGPGGPPPGGN